MGIRSGERTFSAEDFSVEELAARKAAANLSVSVVLPARNEAATIEGMVRACGSLSGTLVDELVVMDGDSTDETAEIAAAAGARVHSDTHVLPEFGPSHGKGDALWRSLSVTSGDIVVFADTDIANPDPRFVWALLGPLLQDPDVAYVKAFYERPIDIGAGRQPSGGGRVTELCARPLLNLFWPALADLIQPLSGEYAGRRTVLEQLPFFTGYGVEIGLLLDILARHGADAIAQVDLRERIHRNQPIDALARMAFGILQVAARRLGAEGRLHADLPTTFLQFERSERGTNPRQREIEVVERPPIGTILR